MLRLLLVCLVFSLTPFAALAEKRLALIIGNDAYAEVPTLRKAVSDADAVAETLGAQGFTVIKALDATRRDMNRSISEFTGQLDRGDTAFVFFAGHGVEIDGENYLLPTDIIAPNAGERDFIKSESIALSSLLDRVRATGARTTLAVIDACRDNPFAATTGRSIGRTRGLGRITAPEGTFVIFSAGAGQLALDELTFGDPNPNSVFTRKLLPKLRQEGLELRALMSELRVEVRDLARTQNHQQFPAYYDELLGDFYFTPAVAKAPEVAPEPVPSAAAAEPAIRKDFQLAMEIGSPAAIEAFLDVYGDSDDFTVGLARSVLAERNAAAVPEEDGNRALAVTPPAEEPVPAPEPAPEPEVETEAPIPDRRTLIRSLQAELRRVGCDAGTPDGVSGPRTRAAFAAFTKAAGLSLTADTIGTPAATEAVAAAKGTVCEAPSGPEGYDLTGTWDFRVNCLLLGSRGTIRYRWAGGNRFTSNSVNTTLGNVRMHGSATVNGRSISGVTITPDGQRITSSSTLSEDGRSYSGRNSGGCSFTGTKR